MRDDPTLRPNVFRPHRRWRRLLAPRLLAPRLLARSAPAPRLLAAAGLLTCATTGGQAADPQPYKVTIGPTGQAAIDKAAHDSSTLISLHDTAPVGAFALIARARSDATRFATVMNSYGYYDGRVAIRIAGRDIDDPGLADALDAAPATDVPVDVTLTPGPLYHLRAVALTGDVPAGARDQLNLKPGAPAQAADVLAAHDRLLNYLLSTGHALARVDAPAATLAPAEHALDVSMQVAAGPRVNLGPIRVTGLEDVNESFVRRRLLLHPGEPYSPETIEKARQDLASEGVFSSVRITTGPQLAPDGTLPVEVATTERPLHAVNLGAAFSTDLGGSVTASWLHRNLFGNGEQLTLSAAATQLGGSVAKQPGYNVGAQLAFPDWLTRDQTLTLSTTALKEYLTAYNRTAYLAGATVARKLSDQLSVGVGLTGEQAKITQEQVTRDYTLVQVPLSVTYDNTGSLFDPTHGFKVNATVTPTESLGRPSATFVISQVTASTYLDLGAPGRSVLALRGLVGVVSGATTYEIPPDQRFYGGGSGTVRGYKYQSIGPKFADNKPIGGTAIDAGTVEFRQRFGESYGAVVFVDAGQVGSSGAPFSGPLKVGAGVGARYYTAIGPIRVDVAVPLNKGRKDEILEAYIGIGQAF